MRTKIMRNSSRSKPASRRLWSPSPALPADRLHFAVATFQRYWSVDLDARRGTILKSRQKQMSSKKLTRSLQFLISSYVRPRPIWKPGLCSLL